MKETSEKKPKYYIVVYRPTLTACNPDIIGFYKFDSAAKTVHAIGESNHKLRAKCEEYDNNGYIEAIVYYCEE